MTYVSMKALCIRFGGATALLAIAAVGGCATSGSHVVQKTQPSITYNYNSDPGLVEATHKAELYCRDYNSWPRTVNLDGGEVTFVCDAPNAVEPDPHWSDRRIDFTFSTDRDLVEATERAHSYCRRYDAEPGDLHVHVNPDGSRTATFVCEG
jgi:hypothetical protein